MLLTLPSGEQIAGEAQRSPITAQALQERTQSYLDAGVEVIWAFEESKARRQGSAWAAQRDWLLEQGLPVLLASLTYEEQPM